MNTFKSVLMYNFMNAKLEVRNEFQMTPQSNLKNLNLNFVGTKLLQLEQYYFTILLLKQTNLLLTYLSCWEAHYYSFTKLS